MNSGSHVGRISGIVVDAKAAPIAGARVVLLIVVDGLHGTSGHRPQRAITSDDGTFAFDGLEAAQYSLQVEKNGFASYPDVFGDGRPERLPIDTHRRAHELRIALQKGAILAGRILNARGEPEADVQVSALRRTDKVGPIGFAQGGHASTNDLGEFRIASLAAGDFQIVAARQRRGPFDAIDTGSRTTLAPTFFPGTIDSAAASVVTLVPGQVVTGLEFTIARVPAFRVSGVVIDRAGQPSPGAIVTLVPYQMASAIFMPMMAEARDDGTFAIGEVLPGSYRAQAQAREGRGGGFLGAVSMRFGAPADADAITVISSDVADLTIVVVA